MQFALIGAALLVPMLLFSLSAAINKAQLETAAWAHTREMSIVMDEHARKVLDTATLILRSIDDHISSLNDEAIAADSTSNYIRSLLRPIEHVVSAWVSDKDGNVLAGTVPWDRQVRITTRDFFAAHTKEQVGLYISTVFVGKATGLESFAISRRRSDPDDTFRGVVHVAMSPQYFSTFYDRVTPAKGNSALLVREDGAILASYPAGKSMPAVFSGSQPFPPNEGAQDTSYFEQTPEYLFMPRQVAAYPLYVVFGVERFSIYSQWFSNLKIFGAASAAAALSLFVMSYLSLRYADGEHRAIVRLELGLTKQTEQSRQLEILAKEAQQAAETKSAFLAAMSHEIRTPLNAVVGFSGMLAQTNMTDEQWQFVDTIKSSAEHLIGIVNDILDYSQLEAGMLELRTDTFSLQDVVRDLNGIMIALRGTKKIQLEAIVAPDVPPVLIGDPGRIYQVLLNLAGNAIKFTEAGRIDVRVSRSGGSDQRPVITFEVCDTGSGMEASFVPLIFNPFEQGKANKGLRASGTGLGLPISQKIVSLMGGSIELESKIGVGSRFWFQIELTVGQAEEYPDVEESTRVLMPSLNILVADDAAASRKLLSLLLSKMGHRVQEAVDGQAALDAIRSRSFDLVLLDLQMPRMGGLEAARQIRAMAGSSRLVPLVAVTAQVMEKDRRDVAEAGINGFLTKPFKQKELAEIIKMYSGEQTQF